MNNLMTWLMAKLEGSWLHDIVLGFFYFCYTYGVRLLLWAGFFGVIWLIAR